MTEPTADFTRALPGGKLDDSTYEAIESALDGVGAPLTNKPLSVGGRFLTLAERVLAFSAEAASPAIGSSHRLAEPKAHIEEAYDDAIAARDEAGLTGSLAECIRFLDAERRALTAQGCSNSPPQDASVGDEGGGATDDEAELCALIFDNVEASVDYVGGKPIAVLSDVKAAADAIMAAGYRRAPQPDVSTPIRKGWCWVPVEPTEEMLHAGASDDSPRKATNTLDRMYETVGLIYRAMIAASPLSVGEGMGASNASRAGTRDHSLAPTDAEPSAEVKP